MEGNSTIGLVAMALVMLWWPFLVLVGLCRAACRGNGGWFLVAMVWLLTPFALRFTVGPLNNWRHAESVRRGERIVFELGYRLWGLLRCVRNMAPGWSTTERCGCGESRDVEVVLPVHGT